MNKCTHLPEGWCDACVKTLVEENRILTTTLEILEGVNAGHYSSAYLEKGRFWSDRLQGWDDTITHWCHVPVLGVSSLWDCVFVDILKNNIS